jgi:hypothetical protein
VDYYQSVVVDYIRADRAFIVNTECCIQLNDNPNPDGSGPHWYCDVVAIDLRNRAVFLCEISYEKQLSALMDRLKSWSTNWQGVRDALARDCKVDAQWPVRPWLFVRQDSIGRLVEKLELIKGSDGTAAFHPRITPLECPRSHGTITHGTIRTRTRKNQTCPNRCDSDTAALRFREPSSRIRNATLPNAFGRLKLAGFGTFVPGR